jgi:hypothetical protein
MEQHFFQFIVNIILTAGNPLFCFGKSTGVGEGNVIIILWELGSNLNSIEMHSILC